MTCADIEIALCDYMDGNLAPAERAEVERHISGCALCAELVRDAGAALAFMEHVADVEPPPELVTRMYAIPTRRDLQMATMRRGVRAWFHRLFEPLLQPRMVMGLSLTILFFGMMVRCAGIPERRVTRADLNPARVWVGVEDRVHRGWERSVKFYENLRFVYQIQSRLRDWQAQQEQAPGAELQNVDEHQLPAGGKKSSEPQRAAPGK